MEREELAHRQRDHPDERCRIHRVMQPEHIESWSQILAKREGSRDAFLLLIVDGACDATSACRDLSLFADPCNSEPMRNGQCLGKGHPPMNML